MVKEKNLKIKETFSLAFQKHQNKNYRAAEDLYKEVLKIDPDHFESIYLLGSLSVQTYNFERARNYYEKALVIQPNSISLLHSMAILYDSLNEWDKSDKIYINLIKTDSLDAQAFNNYAYSLVERNKDLKRDKDSV